MDIEGPIEALDQGLQLVIDRGGARWQMTGRRHLFFEVDEERAERIFDELAGRFEVRRKSGPSGREKVLTPEPIPEEEDPPTTEPTDDRPKVRLVRIWHTIAELADALGVDSAGLNRRVRGTDVTIRRAILGRGPARVVAYLDSALVDFLIGRGARVKVDLDEDLEERTPLPEAVTLTKPRYTYDALADLVGRSVASVKKVAYRHDLDRTTVPTEGRGAGYAALRSTPALARAMAAAWHLDVTIAPTAREAEPREVAG